MQSLISQEDTHVHLCLRLITSRLLTLGYALVKYNYPQHIYMHKIYREVLQLLGIWKQNYSQPWTLNCPCLSGPFPLSPSLSLTPPFPHSTSSACQSASWEHFSLPADCPRLPTGRMNNFYSSLSERERKRGAEEKETEELLQDSQLT